MPSTHLRTDKDNGRVLIVGPLPPPIGGVSSHIAGLANLLVSNSLNCTVIDSYPAKGDKIKIEGITHTTCGGHFRYLKVISVLCRTNKRKNEVIHFHFSSIIGKILPLSLLLPKFKRKFFLTVHHGNQTQIFNESNWLLKLLAKLVLGRMDMVFALSQAQLEFFLSIGIPQKKILLWRVPALLPIVSNEELLPKSIHNLHPVENGGPLSILLTSGYSNEHYQFEDCLKLLNKASALFPCCLIVCFYGISQNKKYEEQLRNKLSQYSNVFIVEALPPSGFHALLSRASIYLRPSKVDSYGLAITEALNLDIPCVASDICERDDRCITYPLGDYEKFEQKSLNILTLGRQLKYRQSIEALQTDGLKVIIDCYKSMFEQ